MGGGGYEGAELLARLCDGSDGFFGQQRGVAEDGGGCAQLAEGAEHHWKTRRTEGSRVRHTVQEKTLYICTVYVGIYIYV